LLLVGPVADRLVALTAAGLALALAEEGRQTLLVDADMRRPRLAPLLGLEATVGLSDVLAGDAALETALRLHPTLPLAVLGSGSPVKNPSELLESPSTYALVDELARLADIVIVDTPALLAASDAAIAARMVNAVILVVRARSTRVDQLDLAAQSLRTVGAELLGVVLNGLPARDGPRYYAGRRTRRSELM
jgi:receptor protein-tyrosine kinase